MSDTVKLIIEITNPPKNDHERWVLAHGIPLDDVKAEIEQKARPYEIGGRGNGKSIRYGLCMALQIIDNIGKAESEEE